MATEIAAGIWRHQFMRSDSGISVISICTGAFEFVADWEILHHMPCFGAEIILGLTLAKCDIREAVASLREMNFLLMKESLSYK